MLSGGQLKRAVLGCEMLAKPSLLFLDEVTSGLDEQTDREIMSLFKKIAQDKKTVLCVTHNLANVEANCDRVVVLTEGGMLAFIGSPSEALKYFSIKQLGDMYQKLKEKPATQWQDEFAESVLYQREISRRMPRNLPEPDDDFVLPPVDARKQAHDVGRQIPVLISRYSAVMRADRLNLVAMLGQSVLVALLIILLFGDLDLLTADDAADPDTMIAAGSTYDPVDVKTTEYSQKILFLMAISCFWFGCNNSVKEIVKEREIFVRERDVNLSAVAYYSSKIAILIMAALMQVTLLTFAINAFCSLPGSFGLQFLTMGLLATVGVTSGLLISSVSKSEDAAISAVPILLIPQIILAGFIAPTEGVLETLSAMFVSCHAGYQSASATLPEPLNEIAGFEDGSVLSWHVVLVLQAVVLASVSMFVLMHRRTQNRLVHMSRDAVSKGVKATIKRLPRKLRRQKQTTNPGTD